MKKTGYRIIEESSTIKRNSVVESECKCPVCGNRSMVKVTPTSPANNVMQNRYECTCGTVWEGNTYDDNWNLRPVPLLKSGKAKGFFKAIAKIAILIIYLIAILVIAKDNVFFGIGVAIYNAVMALMHFFIGIVSHDLDAKKEAKTKAAILFTINCIYIFLWHLV